MKKPEDVNETLEVALTSSGFSHFSQSTIIPCIY